MPDVVPVINEFLQAVGMLVSQYLPEILMAGLLLVSGAFGLLLPFSVAAVLNKVASPYALQGYVALCVLLLAGLVVFELVRRKVTKTRKPEVGHA